MSTDETREVWQRGPIEGIPPLLQPIAHALLQAVEDAERLTLCFPSALLWERPAGLASPGFHLLHAAGVVDRLFTYARGEALTNAQRVALTAETTVPIEPTTPQALVERLREQVATALEQLRHTPESSLPEPRALGRKQIPTTVIGLLFHAAEHVQRHIGQLLVTTKVLLASADNP
jgi:hypothetical protein